MVYFQIIRGSQGHIFQAKMILKKKCKQQFQKRYFKIFTSPKKCHH